MDALEDYNSGPHPVLRFRFEGLAEVLEQQKQLKRGHWRRLEFEVFIKSPRCWVEDVNRRLSGQATLLMLLEQHIEEFLPSAEIRHPEPPEGVSQVDHATARSEVKNAERTGYFESLSPRCCRASAIVDEDEVSRERQSEGDRRLLALVQRAQHWIISYDDYGYLKPVGRRVNPVSFLRGRMADGRNVILGSPTHDLDFAMLEKFRAHLISNPRRQSISDVWVNRSVFTAER